MVNRPKAIGTKGESAVVAYLREHGWPGAERRALAGWEDKGDVAGTPGIAWEVKAGAAAHAAQPADVAAWLGQAEAERAHAGASVAVLVLARRGYGATRTGAWWTVVRIDALAALLDPDRPPTAPGPSGTVWMELALTCHLLRGAGYGDPLVHPVGASAPNAPTTTTDDPPGEP